MPLGSIPEDPVERGGYAVFLRWVGMTPKAHAQFMELKPGESAEDFVARVQGETARRWKDRAPYFVLKLPSEGLRVSLCVQHGRTLESGRFVVVTVQELHR